MVWLQRNRSLQKSDKQNLNYSDSNDIYWHMLLLVTKKYTRYGCLGLTVFQILAFQCRNWASTSRWIWILSKKIWLIWCTTPSFIYTSFQTPRLSDYERDEIILNEIQEESKYFDFILFHEEATFIRLVLIVATLVWASASHDAEMCIDGYWWYKHQIRLMIVQNLASLLENVSIL